MAGSIAHSLGTPVFQRLISAITAIALAISCIGAGFVVCVLPPVTHFLANSCSDDMGSPFDRTQLVQVADATREYSFGSHDLLELYRALYEVNQGYRANAQETGGKVEGSFPSIDDISEGSSVIMYESVFSGTDDRFGYSPEVIAHLDDCNAIARIAYTVIAVCVLISALGLLYVGVKGHKHLLGGVLMASGISVIALFALCGAWALIDFNGFFESLHTLFFSQGNWTFPADSLLICALPESFWAGMGVIWLGASTICAIACILVGLLVRKK